MMPRTITPYLSQTCLGSAPYSMYDCSTRGRARGASTWVVLRKSLSCSSAIRLSRISSKSLGSSRPQRVSPGRAWSVSRSRPVYIHEKPALILARPLWTVMRRFAHLLSWSRLLEATPFFMRKLSNLRFRVVGSSCSREAEKTTAEPSLSFISNQPGISRSSRQSKPRRYSSE